MTVGKLSRRFAGLGSVFVFFAVGERARASCGLEEEVLCEAEYQTVRACDRDVQIRTYCTNSRLPAITTAMRAEAKNYPELQDDYQRTNACLSDTGECTAHDGKTGGEEVAEEVMRYRNLKDPDQVEPLRKTITGEERETNRDAATLVMKRGFARSAVDYHMLFRVFHDREFHGSAEGVALVSKKIVDQELAEQVKLTAILKEMRLKFTDNGDKRSLRSTSTYEGIAMGQTAMLEAVSCELARLAWINRDRQNRMSSLIPGDLLKNSAIDFPFSHRSKDDQGNPSDISGTDREPAAVQGSGELNKLALEEEKAEEKEQKDDLAPGGELSAIAKMTEALRGMKLTDKLGDAPAQAAVQQYSSLEARLRAEAVAESFEQRKRAAEIEAGIDLFTRVRKKYRERDKAEMLFRIDKDLRELTGRDL